MNVEEPLKKELFRNFITLEELRFGHHLEEREKASPAKSYLEIAKVALMVKDGRLNVGELGGLFCF